MEIKNFNCRFVPKGDTEVNWNKAIGFIPLDKEIIIYKVDENHTIARIKIGDGKTSVQDLPFAGADMEAIEKLINEKGDLLIEYVDNAVATITHPTVDQKYNSTSENAQSGLAVAEAIKPIIDKDIEQDGKLNGKLDKSGGTITGTLIVEDGIDSTLSALVVKNGEATYGLTLEDDTYKLGKGSVDENNNFTFDDGDGLPVALRDDSSAFTNDSLVSWSEEGNKFVDSGITKEEINNKITSKASEVPSGRRIYGIQSGKDTLYYMTQVDGTSQIESNNNNATIAMYNRGCLSGRMPENPYHYTPKKYVDEKFTNGGEVTGYLTLPNAPTTPEEATVTDTYTMRQTANPEITGLTVIDGSDVVVDKVQGATVKTSNLFNIDNPLLATNNINHFTQYSPKIENGIIYNGGVYGKSRGVEICIPVKKNTDYTFSFEAVIDETVPERYCQLIGISGLGDDNIYTSSNTINTIAQVKKGVNTATANSGDWEYIGIVFWGLTQYSISISKLQVNEGSTALPYRPYFSGLKNAYFEGVKSTGTNLFNETAFSEFSSEVSKEIYNGEECFKLAPKQVNHRIPFKAKAGDTITVSVEFYAPNGSNLTFALTGDEDSKGTWLKDINIAEAQTSLVSMTFTKTASYDCKFLDIRCYSFGLGTTPYYFKSIQLNYGSTALSYEPYKENNFSLNSPIELGKWDYIDFERQKIVRGTKTRIFDGTESWILQSVNSHGIYNYQVSATGTTGRGGICNLYNIQHTVIAKTTDEGFMLTTGGGGILFIRTKSYTSVEAWKAHLAELYASGNPLVISYELATPTEEDIDISTDKYTVWNGGSETVIQGENDNSAWDAIPTITQKYFIHENPKEVAIKEYVNNGLAKKLDKTGGTITGNLVVEGKTETALGAIISKKDNITYGLAYDNEAFKLGLGELSEEGDFSFAEGEGLPIALRDDSSMFADGALVAWSSDGNKLIDSGVTAETVNNKLDKLAPSATGRRVYAYDASDSSVTNYSLSSDIATAGNGKIPFYRNVSQTAGAVPQHKTNKIATIYVNKPLSNYEAANKAYVDEKVGDATIATFNITEANTTITLLNLIGMTCIDWGDDTIPSASLTHTYAAAGTYECKIYGVTEIGTSAFGRIAQLKEIKVGNSVINITDDSFGGCTGLKKVYISDSIVSIGWSVTFMDCTNLEEVYLGKNIQDIGYEAFARTKLKKIEIPEKVTSVGDWCFMYCTELEEVVMNPTVPPQLAASPFDGCTNLKRIIVPHESYEAYKTAWTNYATLIDSYVLMSDLKAEEWTFTLTDGSTVTKKVVVL